MTITKKILAAAILPAIASSVFAWDAMNPNDASYKGKDFKALHDNMPVASADRNAEEVNFLAFAERLFEADNTRSVDDALAIPGFKVKGVAKIIKNQVTAMKGRYDEFLNFGKKGGSKTGSKKKSKLGLHAEWDNVLSGSLAIEKMLLNLQAIGVAADMGDILDGIDLSQDPTDGGSTIVADIAGIIEELTDGITVLVDTVNEGDQVQTKTKKQITKEKKKVNKFVADLPF